MIRLGVRLALHGGRSGLVRVMLIATALAAGAATLIVGSWAITAAVARYDRAATRGGGPFAPLGTLAHRPQHTPLASVANGKPFVVWSSSRLSAPHVHAITSLGIAPSGPDAPRPPGVRAIPRPGTSLVSPALRDILRRDDSAALRTTLPARIVGTVGNDFLSDPRELVILSGYEPDVLERLDPASYVITSFRSSRSPVALLYFLPIAVLTTLTFLLPLLVFVGSAARLGARRREERLAIMRLLGATPGQARVVAAAETTIAAFIGMLAGVLVALALRAWLVGHGTYAARELPTSPVRLLALAAVVPAVAAISAPLALRRVGMSPLGVERRAHRRSVSAWRWWLLLAGWTAFAAGAVLDANGGGSTPNLLLTVGVVAVALGLVGAGPWVVQRVAQVVEGRAERASELLAARRLTEDPRAGFRPMTVLVVTTFAITMIVVVVPAARQTARDSVSWSTAADRTAHPELQVAWNDLGTDHGSVTAVAGARLGTVEGVKAVVRLQAAMETSSSADPGLVGGAPSFFTPATGVIVADCPDFAVAMHASAARCRAGVLVGVSSAHHVGDPITLQGTAQQPAFASLSLTVAGRLPLLDRAGIVALVPPAIAPAELRDPRGTQALWLGTDGSAATARRIQGALIAAAPGAALAPGRTPAFRPIVITTAHWLLYAVLGLVLVLAACSLAVTVVDQIFDRRRSLAILRALGTPLSLLRRVTLLEVGTPLLIATAIGALNGVVMGVVFVLLNGGHLVVPWVDVVVLPALVAAAWLIVTAIGLAALGRAAPAVPLRTG